MRQPMRGIATPARGQLFPSLSLLALRHFVFTELVRLSSRTSARIFFTPGLNWTSDRVLTQEFLFFFSLTATKTSILTVNRHWVSPE